MKFQFLKFKILIFVILLSTFYLLFSNSVLAVDYVPLVPCGLNAQPIDSSGNRIGDPNLDYTHPCTRCDTFRLVKNVIDLILYGIVPPVAAVLFILGGLIILLAGARPEWIISGKKIFWNTFIGLVIILASWMITNTFIKSFGPEQIKTSWFKYTCEEEEITGPGGPGGICLRPQELAQQFNVPYPVKRAPELDTLITCVNSKLSSFIDQNQIYTYDVFYPLCNYTRGQTICGECSHTLNSCHYGGPNGTQGALGVDFNAEGISEQELFQKLKSIETTCNFGYILFGNDHTHVSTKSCAGN